MMHSHHCKVGRIIATASLGLCFLTLSGSARADFLTANWVCGSGDWNDLSCWSFVNADPNQTPTMDDLAVANLVFSDNTDRVITRSVHAPELYYTSIDSTGSGTTTLVHTGGIVGAGGLPTTHEVGVQGTGTLIQTGGSIIGSIYFGLNPGSHGTFDLVGGVTNTFEGIAYVGYGGSGLVNQSDGLLDSMQLIIGDQAGSNGTYNLSGGRINMAYNGEHDISWIGRAGTGTFNQTGGTHEVQTGIIVGGTETGHGTYNLHDGVARSLQAVIIGDEGEGLFVQTGGTLEVSGGTTINYSPTYPVGLLIGNGANGQGTYNLIDGAFTPSSYFYNDVTVGNEGRGVINQFGGTFDIANCTISQGAGCETYYGTGTLNLAKQAGSTGTFNLVGGTTVTNGINVGIGGDGVFNQLGGSNEIKGTLAIANPTQGGTGVYTLKGGTLAAENIVVSKDGTFNFDGGSVTTDLFANAGKVALGDPAVDTTIIGNYAQLSSGILQLGADYTPSGAIEYNRLDVTQMAILGGTLDFSFDLDPGAYADGLAQTLYEFDLFSADTILGEFDFLQLPDLGVLDPLYDWDVSYLLNDFGTDYVRLSMVRTPSAVPEPSTLLLLLPGLVGMGVAGRRLRTV